MQQQNLPNSVKNELKKWSNKVFFPDEAFKENTEADLSLLDNYLDFAREDFIILASETEACVYKIGRYFIEKGVQSDRFTFQDGEYFEAYIDPLERNVQKVRDSIDNLLKDVGRNIKGKWLVIPELNCPWDKKTALYFIGKLKQYGCYGLIFYSSKSCPDTLAQVLVEETYFKIYQFPKSNFKNKKNQKELPEDKY